MHAFGHLHAAYADPSIDPCLHGIARGFGQLYAAEENALLPDGIDALLRRLTDRDETVREPARHAPARRDPRVAFA